jgi:replication fork protection complex subunit Tof1/Swi1
VTKKVKPHEHSDGPSSANVQPPSKPYVLHRQRAITTETGEMFDAEKKQRTKKGKTIDPLAREDTLSLESRRILQDLAKNFIKSCFSCVFPSITSQELFRLNQLLAAFLSSLLKDIKSERPKISEKDNLRLLFITKWFLEFFLQAGRKEKALKKENNWDYGFVAEVMDRAWIAWVLKRMREALDAKVLLLET